MSRKNDLMAKKIVESQELWSAARRAFPILQIRKLMREKNLLNKDLAERLGMTEASISRLLRGAQNLKLDTLYMLADAIEEPLNILVGPQDKVEAEFDDVQAANSDDLFEGGFDNVVELSNYRPAICGVKKANLTTFSPYKYNQAAL